MSEHKPTAKRVITPVTITVTVEASRINENGTFSGFVVKSVKGPNGTCKAVSPPVSGGGLYLQVASLEGIKFLSDSSATAPKEKAKLF